MSTKLQRKLNECHELTGWYCNPSANRKFTNYDFNNIIKFLSLAKKTRYGFMRKLAITGELTLDAKE
jgi:hypothetical protein